MDDITQKIDSILRVIFVLDPVNQIEIDKLLETFNRIEDKETVLMKTYYFGLLSRILIEHKVYFEMTDKLRDKFTHQFCASMLIKYLITFNKPVNVSYNEFICIIMKFGKTHNTSYKPDEIKLMVQFLACNKEHLPKFRDECLRLFRALSLFYSNKLFDLLAPHYIDSQAVLNMALRMPQTLTKIRLRLTTSKNIVMNDLFPIHYRPLVIRELKVLKWSCYCPLKDLADYIHVDLPYQQFVSGNFKFPILNIEYNNARTTPRINILKKSEFRYLLNYKIIRMYLLSSSTYICEKSWKCNFMRMFIYCDSLTVIARYYNIHKKKGLIIQDTYNVREYI